MCGIFGFVVHSQSTFPRGDIRTVATRLFELSESRGKDASGVAVFDASNITVFKQPQRARTLIRASQYHSLFQSLLSANGSTSGVIGHARMVTNGDKETHANNQPVTKQQFVGLHNGIVVNDQALWDQYPMLERHYQVDTEVILSLIAYFEQQGHNLTTAVAQAFACLQGANSLALLSAQVDALVLASSNGSLYFIHTEELLLFASEKYILQEVQSLLPLSAYIKGQSIAHVEPGEGYIFSFADMQPHCFMPARQPEAPVIPACQRKIVDLPAISLPQRVSHPAFALEQQRHNDQFVERVDEAVSHLRRCTRCLLPETFPFIRFDADGVCSYCHNYRKTPIHGQAALEDLVAPVRQRTDGPNCLVPLSGGRDSCYALHYIKTELGLNPVAYTYDWGMVTDLARRNISRMCGALGVEHILVSADIQRKRRNIRKNVLAWLKRPDLGTVPLFMAGDKQFFYYAHSLRKMMNLDLVFFSQNDMERTDFKSGFCGIDENNRKGVYWNLSVRNKVQLALYYGRQFLQNPSYLNDTMLDTAWGFASYYLLPREYTLLFQYLPWDENFFSETLLREYDWELATDTDTTWRIGDGTAPFYNYIYYVMAGFTENDTFRSNQIREGMISRDEALKLVRRDNHPRYESMQWYCDAIGVDLGETINRINQAPRRYTL